MAFNVIDCKKCEASEECEKKAEMQRNLLFSYHRETLAGCKDYSPRRFHGLEGVAA